jgi:microcompartment protein CcmL/EutN
MADGIDGKAYFIVEGIIGDVEAAVEAGETRAADQLVASVVIAQLTDELRADLQASSGFLDRVRTHETRA